MDFSWPDVVTLLLLAIFLNGVILLSLMKKLSARIDAIEIDRAWFINERNKQIETIQGDLIDLKNSLSDLAEFHKGSGR